MPVQPRTRAGLTGRHRRSNEGACPASSSRRPTSLYKFVSHTLWLTHKLVIHGGCSAPSPGQANCLLSHLTPGIDFHSNLHASGGGGAALPPEPIVHSWTTPGVANPPHPHIGLPPVVPGMGRLFRSDRPVPPASASPPLLGASFFVRPSFRLFHCSPPPPPSAPRRGPTAPCVWV